MIKYRIIYLGYHDIDPCRWQAQERVWLFFWRNMCGATASPITQGKQIMTTEYLRKEAANARAN